ncbi:MAG: helix-turn-helix domain-containing protein [Desulfobulbaceae bacterium]|nr:helix-turn-helix domain-containing protein [Desulfobulbaceae bacterium]
MTTEQTDNEERLENTLGELLHRTRKAGHKTVEEAAEATKIPTNFIRALERDDFEKLPGEVFVRGFIRLYASYLGLDPDDTFKHYAVQEEVESQAPRVNQYRNDVIDEEIMDRTSIFIKKKKSKVLPIIILLLILILFYIFGVFFKSEDRFSNLPTITDITSSRIDDLPPPGPGEASGPEETPSRVSREPAVGAGESTGEATPEVPEKEPATSENMPVPEATAVEPTADLTALTQPGTPARRSSPFTVSVATDKEAGNRPSRQ